MNGKFSNAVRKIGIFICMSNLFIHSVIGASTVNGVIEGSGSMPLTLILIIILSRVGHKHNQK